MLVPSNAERESIEEQRKRKQEEKKTENAKKTLLERHAEQKEIEDGIIHIFLFVLNLFFVEIDPMERQRKEEEDLLKNVTQTSLLAVSEIAKGVQYTESFNGALVFI